MFNLAHNSIINIYYFDECGFSMMPNIPYGYQPKGEQWEYPSIRKKVKNTAGFLDPFTNHLVTYDLPKGENMNSEYFIKYMNDFANKITQETVVILDNAPWHKSAASRAMFEGWKKQGLQLFFLPPNCPHLNKIEILWGVIKYQWLYIRDYRSESTLNKKLNHIFKTYGLNYLIDFSLEVNKSK
jgi:transposase